MGNVAVALVVGEDEYEVWFFGKGLDAGKSNE
jgi:hypothetical protein